MIAGFCGVSLSGNLVLQPERPADQKYARSTKSAKSTVDVGCINLLRGLRGGGEGVVTGCRGVLFEMCLEIL